MQDREIEFPPAGLEFRYGHLSHGGDPNGVGGLQWAFLPDGRLVS